MSDQRICTCDDCLQIARRTEVAEASQDRQIVVWTDNPEVHKDKLTIKNGTGWCWTLTHCDARADVLVDNGEDEAMECVSMHDALRIIAEVEDIDPDLLIYSILHRDSIYVQAAARLRLEYMLLSHSNLMGRVVEAECGHSYVVAVPGALLDISAELRNIDTQRCPSCAEGD